MKLFLILIVCLVVIVISCGPPKPSEDDRYSGCLAQEVLTEVNDGRMTVIWKNQCNRLISGYNIYISEHPIAALYPGRDFPGSISPFNHTVFLGDTDPTDSLEHFEAGGLDNGKPYYVSVRIVYPDRSMSKPSNEVRTICGPRGELDLSIRLRGEHNGFCFAANEYVPSGDIENDLYYFSKDGRDYLVSPTQLDAYLNYSKLKVLPFTGEISDFRDKLSRLGQLPTKERVEVKKGTWVWLITARDQYALLKVTGFTGEGRLRRVQLEYAFVPANDLTVF